MPAAARAQGRRDKDPRDIATGLEIPTEVYADHPFLIQMDDGNWLAVVTTGKAGEGSRSQHVVTRISTDKGKTWTKPVAVEPSGPPESSWGVPLKVPGGRVYVFYLFNYRNRRYRRSDNVGQIFFRYSDDYGRSWSKGRYMVPSRRFEIDITNQAKGRDLFMIPFCKPRVIGKSVMLALSKHNGPPAPTRSECALLKSDNILTEAEPQKIRFETLPAGRFGLRHPKALAAAGPISEECTFDVLSDNKTLYATHRSRTGFLLASVSGDLGRTWKDRQVARYFPGGRAIKNPRGPAVMRKFSNGKFLLLFYLNGRTDHGGRNPYWLSGGLEAAGTIHWTQPEIALYDKAADARPGYADFLEDPETHEIYVVASQKRIARVHKLDMAMVEDLWNQFDNRFVATAGLILDLAGQERRGPPVKFGAPLDLIKGTGMAIEMWIRLDDLRGGQVVLDGRDLIGRGITVTTAAAPNGKKSRQPAKPPPGATLRLDFSDGHTPAGLDLDAGLLKPNKLHHVVFIVDSGPRIIFTVVDGVVCDGGRGRTRGWTRYARPIGDITGARRLKIAPSLRGQLKLLRIYNRYLGTSEAVGNYRAGAK